MNVKEKIEYLPHTPGVYRYLDESGTVIYVGKAKDLKRRVLQYFVPPEQLNRKTRALVEKIADLQYTLVETEEDALLLENNLIKQLQPRYNILLKDDKTYPWICIRNEHFPRVMLTRRYVKDGSLYYGPYASVQHARKILDLAGNLYKLRICSYSLDPDAISSGKVKSCLNYHLKRCAAPCEGLFSEEEYNAQIEDIKALLSGRVRSLIASCREKMMESSADLRFEDAQIWKERMTLLEAHHERQKVVGHGILDMETYRLLQEKKLPRRIEHSEKVMEQLRKDLGMSEMPRHIECFDNSNIQGTNPVAACVVFRDAIPSKKDYRHFLVRTVVGANDYASMKEIVNRRYSRLLAEGEELPQLIVIDGGKGQLKFALEALAELGIRDKVFVVGLAERMEEVIVPGESVSLFLDKNSSSLRVLMHIRDEAHRFGITHHRNRRSASQVESALRSIPGVGEITEQKLIRHFRSVKRIREATLEELSSVTGPVLAKKIKQAL
ncbi:MAG: excinuclease ABC subunit UvrC [Bacteroidales bacterium]|nr:excinuclease ABC subunit UvrC [Candidatus Cacconaster merdequi]